MTNRPTPVVTPERFAAGMTFEEYLAYAASPENLSREGNDGSKRIDRTATLRSLYDNAKLNQNQLDALSWLVAQPNGPAKVLVIAEDWSSDCRRDLPTVARIAEAGGLELRIFNRDGAHFSTTPAPSPDESPSADLMSQFLNAKRDETWQSIPVVAFFTRDMQYLYHYAEYPAIYDKDRIVYGHIRVPQAGETPQETSARIDKEFGGLQTSPWFRIWAAAAVDEMLSALQRRLVLGAV